MVGAFGNYTGSCIVCLTGTDTGLGFRGTADWLAGALVALGVPEVEAIATIETVPLKPVDGADRFEAIFRVCRSCVAKTKIPAKPSLLFANADVPLLQEAI